MGDFIICPMLCYSNATDNELSILWLHRHPANVARDLAGGTGLGQISENRPEFAGAEVRYNPNIVMFILKCVVVVVGRAL